MASISLELSASDLHRIKKRLTQIENKLVDESGPVLKYYFSLALDYSDSVVSGMGTIPVGTVMDDIMSGTLNPFMRETVTVRWQNLAGSTIRKKRRSGLTLAIWMATGETARAVKPVLKAYKRSAYVFAGIDKNVTPEAFKKALATETGAGGNWAQRALFSTLNEVFLQHLDELRSNVQKAVRETIDSVGWGK